MQFHGIIQLLLVTCVLVNTAEGQLPMPAVPDSLHEELPIFIDYEKQVTPYIFIQVNKRKVKAVFDTGSSGLRILSGALRTGKGDSILSRVNYAYGHGPGVFRIEGRLITVPVKLGRLEAPVPVRIMRIDSCRYERGGPWTCTYDSTTIASGHFRDCPAIIGVGLRARASLNGIVSPLAQLPGDGKFIIEFPVYGGRQGRLIINPTEEEAKDFTLFHLKPGKEPLTGRFGSWLDNELNGCMIINGNGFCHPTLLDSGSPDSRISSNEVTGSIEVPPGNMLMKFSDRLDPLTVAAARLTMTGREGGNKSYVSLAATDQGEGNLFGVQAFFAFDVLYDLQNGYIGLKPK
jgi:hypothetical protein